jgi:S-adenosylmethionine:tRNA ribosyltransferase-isomerase
MVYDLNISRFDYYLPGERIAKYPLKDRDASKLLIWQNNEIKQDIFRNLPSYLEAQNLLIFNNTKVIQARILFYKTTGAQIEIFCLEPDTPNDYAENLSQNETCRWKCVIGNRKKWKNQSITRNVFLGDKQCELKATKLKSEEGQDIVEFSWNNPACSFAEILDFIGIIPIPPYLKRASEAIDKKRYQTVYANKSGSVAAPTAGLHFTHSVFNDLNNKGVEKKEITLHVGAGTFTPVKTDSISQHQMHTEHFTIHKDVLLAVLHGKEKIVPVGTTTLRALESVYWIGVKAFLHNLDIQKPQFIDQWEPYEKSDSIPVETIIGFLLDKMDQNKMEYISAGTRIMIVPGYQFKIAKGLITNFHQPKSTLLLLIAAFTGKDNWKKIYNYALTNKFRFLSYGDSCLLMP